LNGVAKSNGRMPGSDSAASDVALSSSSRDADAKSRIADTMCRWCFQSLGPCLKAVVLTGSLARNEATWQQTDGGIRFFSDAEFIVILKDKETIPSPELVTLICRGAEEELRNQGVLCKLSFGAVYETFLLNLGDTIFGHELLTCGEVVYGDPDILLNKARSGARVSQEDAWRMLANRTVELLEIVPELRDGPATLSEAAQYRLTKLYCDMATSILVFKQEFVAGYLARADNLCELHQHGRLSDLPCDADWFVDMVRRCTGYKVAHCWDGASPFAARDSVRQAVTILRSLWAWELGQMHGTTMPSPDVMLRLHMRKQKLKDRLRGWAFVVRRRGMLDSLSHGWRWLRLLRSASPRYCVYAAALNAVSSFEIPASSESNQGSDLVSARMSRLETGNRHTTNVSNWLPIANLLARTAPDEKDIAEAVLWNYREFLVETRA
jgi:hypothetical protein